LLAQLLADAVEAEETINVPVWAGIVAVLVGGGLLFFPAGKRI